MASSSKTSKASKGASSTEAAVAKTRTPAATKAKKAADADTLATAAKTAASLDSKDVKRPATIEADHGDTPAGAENVTRHAPGDPALNPNSPVDPESGKVVVDPRVTWTDDEGKAHTGAK